VTLIVGTVRLWLAMIFAAAAVSKILSWQELPGVIQNFRVLPRGWVQPAAMVLPLLEAVLAVGLLIDAAHPWAPLLAALLFAAFGVALTVNYARGRRHIDCGCFRSGLKQTLTPAILLRNAVLTLCALLLAGFQIHESLAVMDWIVVGAAALTLLLCYFSVGLAFPP